MNTEEEIWKPIPGYPCEASSLGRIRSFYQTKTGRICNGNIARNGYIRVQFVKKDGQKTAHRLIAAAWLPNPNNLPQVNHKNGIKTDNRPDNLEWCTGSQNQIHSLVTGLRKIQYGIHTSGAKFDETQIKTIKICLRDGLRVGQIAKYFKVNPAQISNIKSGKIWKTVTI